MTKNRPKDPPSNLSVEATDLWNRLHADFDLNDANAAAVLEQALRAFDTMRKARAIVSEEGLVTTDRFGQPRPHPAVKIEHDSRQQFFAGMKLLQLPVDGDAAKGPGRPFGS